MGPSKRYAVKIAGTSEKTSTCGLKLHYRKGKLKSFPTTFFTTTCTCLVKKFSSAVFSENEKINPFQQTDKRKAEPARIIVLS